MKYPRARIAGAMIDFFEGDNRRIEHALKVWHYAETIAEKYPGYDEDILVAVSLLHDVGIKLSEDILGYNNGQTQEEYGPDAAEKILTELDFPSEKIGKVREIIGNHHSAPRYDYVELTILRAADAIVNST